MAEETHIHNDEPTNVDALGREKYASAFANIAETSETPLVIGMYGGWGMGKSSLMKLVMKRLDKEKTMAVWFNPWEHQFDDNPVLGLLHRLVQESGKDTGLREELKKLTAVLLGGGLAWLLKASTGLDTKDIEALGDKYEKERFQLKEDQTLLRDRFKQLVDRARDGRRIVFFIDDLDRCMPEQALKLVEALKLCLNFEGCVYFLGVDRKELARSIRHHYIEVFDKEDSSAESYLDKIVQLPFRIPPIADDSMDGYIDSLIGEESGLDTCREILVHGLRGTPRGVKRFINTLTLNHMLASGLEIENYDIRILAAILLIQEKAEDLYKAIAREPTILLKLNNKDESVKDIHERYLDTDEGLRKVVLNLEIDASIPLRDYIYLPEISAYDKEFIDLNDILEKHKIWLESGGEEGERASLGGTDLSGTDLSGTDLRSASFFYAYLIGANLSYANLSYARLIGTNFSESYRTGASRIGNKPSLADLLDADLLDSSPSAANLIYANLSSADLTGANLINANLTNANLSSANLINAYLIGAKLGGAALYGADLSTAKGLEVEQIREAKIDSVTKLPPEIRTALDDTGGDVETSS